MRRALWPECPEERHEKEMKEMLALPDIRAVIVLARDEAQLGGFMEVQVRKGVNNAASDLVAYVEGWYVDEDLRRQGRGKRLLEAAEEWAAERGLTEMASDTEVSNETSVEAHRRLGFEESYRLVHFLKDIHAPEGKDKDG